MLNVTKKQGETLIFLLPDGQEIVILVKILGKGDDKKVELGVQAPQEVRIVKPLRQGA